MAASAVPNSTLQVHNDRYFRGKHTNPSAMNPTTDHLYKSRSSNGGNRVDNVAVDLIDAPDSSMDIIPNKAVTGDVRQHSGVDGVIHNPEFTGTIHPFSKTHASFLGRLKHELKIVLQERQARKIIFLLVVNFLVSLVLLTWCQSTNSMALTAYTYLTIFDMFSLTTCLITVWATKQKPTPMFTFGHERFEVLAVFSSTILAQFGAFFVLKESTERLIEQPDIHTGRLLLGGIVGFFFHLFITYAVTNRAFEHVILAASSSWLQEHFADMSRSMCSVVPGLDKLLLPRVNPLALIGFAGGLSVLATHLLIEINNYYIADTLAAVSLACMICGTMFPMSAYTGKMLLQTTPAHIIGQLDKCLREASTLDGVLEFRNEHFWTISFGTLAGSLHVRIRRDANEQMVLAHVTNRLSNVVSKLTIQVFKDDWARPTPYSSFTGSSIPTPSIPSSKFPSSLATSKTNPTTAFNAFTPSFSLAQHANSIGLPQTPSRAASTPFGTPNKNLSFHTDIEPITHGGHPTGVFNNPPSVAGLPSAGVGQFRPNAMYTAPQYSTHNPNTNR
ncbi:LOW QUALITY PROTEIN: zinc transporter 6-like [Ptychodera flava]|uniref:LOW QUALITY PROTEIN: zinc transporter 6-like n=1 Tax=Ptychodera flava TaxID=63121 RepID=UPI00396A6D95